MNSYFQCNRCLLNIDVPGVHIGSDGICSVCKKHDEEWGNWDQIKDNKLKTLEKMFSKIKRKNRIYDVLVPLSGGKDSIYVLYLCRKVYNLNCLAVTWDNGFLSDHARMNIKNSCNILGVDHAYYRINKDFLFRLYRYFFLKTGFLCPVCMRGIQVAISRIQSAFDIPLAIRGTAHRTEEYVSPDFFLPGSLDFIENVLEGSPLEREAIALLAPVGIFSSLPSIRMPDYIDWDYDKIFKIIINELGWTAEKNDQEHSDCVIDNIIHYIRYKKFPSLLPEMLRYSKLVTAGIINRQEALNKIADQNDFDEEPDNLSLFFEYLNITRDEFYKVLSNPMMHKEFLTPKSRAKRRINWLMKRYFL